MPPPDIRPVGDRLALPEERSVRPTRAVRTLLVGLLLGAALAHFVDSALMRHLALLDRMAI